MVASKNSLNLKKEKILFKKGSSSRQVDGIVKRSKSVYLEQPILKKENQKNDSIIEKTVVENRNEIDNSYIDDNKRMFLKVAGVAGLGLAASALFPKGAEAYVSGSTPTSNVVGLKNVANVKINPATEDTLSTLATESTLGDIKTQSEKLTFDGSNNLLTKGAVTVSNISNTQINPATEEGLANVGQSVNDQSIWMLRKIITLLKPLGMTTGAGSNRLSVDINSGSIGISGTVSTVTTVGTVSSMTNMVNIGNVNAFSLMKDSARNAFSNSIRSQITF